MSANIDPANKCYHTAVRLLSIREHSRNELALKLRTKGYTKQKIEPVLDELESKNLQSDLRFTQNLIRVRQSKGYGPLYVKSYLQEKGVDTQTIESMLDFNDIAWQKALRSSAVKKFGETKPPDFRQKARQVRFLTNRGFTSQQIRDFFDRDHHILDNYEDQ